MSLQIPIQKDIGEYDEKIVGKLTLRTLCCLALGFSAAVAVAAVLHLGLKADVSAMTLPIMAAGPPLWLARAVRHRCRSGSRGSASPTA